MFDIARIKAPAKLNLHLEIGPARQDGFHELISLFQSVSLADELVFRVRDGEGIRISGGFPFPAEENIIAKACVLFMERTGVKTGLDISVKKEIPMGAGLGGGSSDAAAALSALNSLFDTRLPKAELALMGARLGSDVPFFLSGTCAIVRGRGERVDSIDGREGLLALIVDPLFPVPTREAYSLWDRNGEKKGGFSFTAEGIRAEYGKSVAEWGFFNSFYPLLAAEHRVLEDIRDELREDGALYATMSGSGSSIFGIFGSDRETEKAAERQRSLGRKAHSGFLLARMDDVILE